MKKATAKTIGRKDPLASMLRRAGHKATPIRLALIRALKRAKQPLSIHEIWQRTKEEAACLKTKKTADRTTVYRAVNDLKDRGVLRRVDVGHAHTHYELAGDHHHHIICRACGTTEDMRECKVGLIEKRALKDSRLFTSVNTHSLELFGLCMECGGERECL